MNARASASRYLPAGRRRDRDDGDGISRESPPRDSAPGLRNALLIDSRCEVSFARV